MGAAGSRGADEYAGATGGGGSYVDPLGPSPIVAGGGAGEDGGAGGAAGDAGGSAAAGANGTGVGGGGSGGVGATAGTGNNNGGSGGNGSGGGAGGGGGGGAGGSTGPAGATYAQADNAGEVEVAAGSGSILLTFTAAPPAAVAPVPTLGEWAQIGLAGLLGLAAFVGLRRRKPMAK